MAHRLLRKGSTILAEKALNAIESPVDAARVASLRYVSDADAGIRRVRRGKEFVYIDTRGKRITEENELRRIKSLAIPPAWEEVWICPLPHGHIQATGRDARGRKQYRYHRRWREVRDENKYDRMIAFGRALPELRRRLARDLAIPGLPRRKVLATVVSLLESTLIRIGNEEYARNNKSFGLTTMRDRHVKPSRNGVRFEFHGKSRIAHTISVTDPRLAKIVKRCRDLPGYTLFQYVDGRGRQRAVEAADVNQYLREAMGSEFTAKDFRTWAGTVLAYEALSELATFETLSEAKKNVVEAIDFVARKLRNTKAVCRNCYIHPHVIAAYMERDLKVRGRGVEARLMALLEKRSVGEDQKLENALKRSLKNQAGPARLRARKPGATKKSNGR
jgi:DNA topoisomerase I